MTDRPPLPSAFDVLQRLTAGGRPAVFLDYDGTLTPIVVRPELAILEPATRDVLRRLAEVADVAVVSGRDLEDVRALLDLPGITVAGSHGFEVEYPDGRRATYGGGEGFLPVLGKAAEALERGIAGIPGARVERKHFAIAVHFREAPAQHHIEILRVAAEAGESFPELRLGHGKLVVELRPAVDWDKGRLVSALLAERPQAGHTVAVYLGDDVTDEDAFEALNALTPPGISVVVGERALGETAATHALPDVASVAAWLDELQSHLAQ